MTQLRLEADNANIRADDAEAKIKIFEQRMLELEQAISSLEHKNGLLEGQLEKSEAKVSELKLSSSDNEHTKSTSEGLLRKVQLLEDELDAAEKNLKETVEKYASLDLFHDKVISDDRYSPIFITDCDKLMSRRSTLRDRCSALKRSAMLGRRNTRCVSSRSPRLSYA
jgi:tropomyosin